MNMIFVINTPKLSKNSLYLANPKHCVGQSISFKDIDKTFSFFLREANTYFCVFEKVNNKLHALFGGDGNKGARLL